MAAGGRGTFGAPGLLEGSAHLFRVAFCDETGCTCWSGNSAQYSTTSFPGAAPLPPTDTVQEVEDNFHRRISTPKAQGGDGLGPDGVWIENTMNPGTKIGDDADSALVLPSGFAMYLARQATHEHSFAEVRLAKDDPTEAGYNFEVEGRIHMTGAGSMDAYLVKLVRGWRGCDGAAALIIGRATEQAVLYCDGDPPAPAPDRGILIPGSPPVGTCNEALPLSTGGSVWLRIETTDSAASGEPEITGTVAWGSCPAGSGISGCEHVCTFTRTDVGDPGSMLRVKGEWGFTGHDVHHRIEIFRAGSQADP